MKKILMMAVAALLVVNTGIAQQKGMMGGGKRDPKMMTAKVAEKLNFSADQNARLKALNAKYPGAEYDRMKYREEFRAILTADQKKEMEEMKKKRMGKREVRTVD